MSERIISPVNDNAEKQLTYRKMMGRYNMAIKYGFFYEAIMIAYAMIEDRLRAMIYHMGFLANRKSISVWPKTKPFLTECVDENKEEQENLTLGVKSLSGKMKIVRCVYLWAEKVEKGYEDKPFAVVLKSQIEGTDVAAVLDVLKDIEKWKAGRNEIVHAMMNKNLASLEAVIEMYAVEGMRIARTLDAQERLLKKGNVIRRKMNLPNK